MVKFLLTMSELALVSISARSLSDPILAHFSLVEGFILFEFEWDLNGVLNL